MEIILQAGRYPRWLTSVERAEIVVATTETGMHFQTVLGSHFLLFRTPTNTSARCVAHEALRAAFRWSDGIPAIPQPLSEIPLHLSDGGRRVARLSDIPPYPRVHFLCMCGDPHAGDEQDADAWLDFIGRNKPIVARSRSRQGGLS